MKRTRRCRTPSSDSDSSPDSKYRPWRHQPPPAQSSRIHKDFVPPSPPRRQSERPTKYHIPLDSTYRSRNDLAERPQTSRLLTDFVPPSPPRRQSERPTLFHTPLDSTYRSRNDLAERPPTSRLLTDFVPPSPPRRQSDRPTLFHTTPVNTYQPWTEGAERPETSRNDTDFVSPSPPSRQPERRGDIRGPSFVLRPPGNVRQRNRRGFAAGRRGPTLNFNSEFEIRIVADDFRMFDSLYWHDVLLLIRRILSSDDVSKFNMGLRAARNAAWLPNEFVTIGKMIGEGAYGKAYLIKTKKGKRYVLKRETMGGSTFREDITRIATEKNAMMMSKSHKYIIHIKGSWTYRSLDDFILYTVVEYADYGPISRYINLSRPGMRTLKREAIWYDSNAEGRAALIKMKLAISRAREDANPIVYKGFRATVLRFSYEYTQALIFLHKTGIIHNDLHPGNILVGKGFHIKICDFGNSKIKHTVYRGIYHPRGNPVNLRKFRPYTDVYSKRHDFVKTLYFFLFLTNGITGDNDFIIQSEGTEDEFSCWIHPTYKPVLFYDEFLSRFSDVIVSLALEEANDVWPTCLKQELTIFSNRYGQEYINFDFMPYVTTLYDSDTYSSDSDNATLSVMPEHPHLFDRPLENPAYKRISCLSFLDDSFLREQDEDEGQEEELVSDAPTEEDPGSSSDTEGHNVGGRAVNRARRLRTRRR